MLLIKAFSLIELIVVIAIVLTIAAFAVPQYRLYREAASVSRALTTLYDLQQNSILYYHIKGVYADAAQLGLPPHPFFGSGATGYTDPAVYDLPNLNLVAVYDEDLCGTGKTGTVLANFTPPPGAINVANIQLVFTEIDGTMHTYCTYTLTGNDPNTSFLPGCKNYYGMYGGVLGGTEVDNARTAACL
jgi:prepilin-type N-terminal cleavage/methylation domain-containing protein